MYTTDTEGRINNSVVAPQMYDAEYLSPEQHVRYALQGAAAILSFTVVLLSAFTVTWKFF